MSTFKSESGVGSQAGHDTAAAVATPAQPGLGARTSPELIRSISEHDAQVAYKTKGEDEGLPPDNHGSEHGGGGNSSGTDTSDEKVVVAWKPDDPENPYNFSTVSVSVSVSTLGTTRLIRLTKCFTHIEEKGCHPHNGHGLHHQQHHGQLLAQLGHTQYRSGVWRHLADPARLAHLVLSHRLRLWAATM